MRRTATAQLRSHVANDRETQRRPYGLRASTAAARNPGCTPDEFFPEEMAATSALPLGSFVGRALCGGALVVRLCESTGSTLATDRDRVVRALDGKAEASE